MACEREWEPVDIGVSEPCPSCGQNASAAQRCESCPVVEVQRYRDKSATGLLLARVLEHEFDTKHYRVDPGEVPADVREGLRILESERTRWERETREKAEQEREERARIQEMQRKQRGF